ncbi:MAG: hypothetical protein JW811_04485, partial [Clostridiales bacterium]|nr:hypothetical protein [Clostridiales bacterium]
MAEKKTSNKTIQTFDGDKDAVRKEKLKALENALSQLNKTYGKGAVMKYSDVGAIQNLNVISTGNLLLDICLGVGGLPRGRVVEIYGP